VSVVVRAMTPEEFERWLPQARRGYAADMVRAGVDEDAAREKAERDSAGLLSGGVASEGQLLFTVEEDGEAAGGLWLAERELDGSPALFVYDVRIDEDRRGRGLGRAALLFAESEARRRGLSQIALNVFGGNEVARGLYRSLGFREAAIHMTKRLDPPP
jgi:ribosomal protein S18 acetylase RimI-like enzyme